MKPEESGAQQSTSRGLGLAPATAAAAAPAPSGPAVFATGSSLLEDVDLASAAGIHKLEVRQAAQASQHGSVVCVVVAKDASFFVVFKYFRICALTQAVPVLAVFDAVRFFCVCFFFQGVSLSVFGYVFGDLSGNWVCM